MVRPDLGLNVEKAGNLILLKWNDFEDGTTSYIYSAEENSKREDDIKEEEDLAIYEAAWIIYHEVLPEASYEAEVPQYRIVLSIFEQYLLDRISYYWCKVEEWLMILFRKRP